MLLLQQPPPEIKATDFAGMSQPHQEETAAALRGAVAATFRGKFNCNLVIEYTLIRQIKLLTM